MVALFSTFFSIIPELTVATLTGFAVCDTLAP